MSEFTYNLRKDIRTSHRVEKIFSTANGFIGRLPDVEYLQNSGAWVSQGSRWLINEENPVFIMDYGFKSTQL
jgi:hypothetical protein